MIESKALIEPMLRRCRWFMQRAVERKLRPQVTLRTNGPPDFTRAVALDGDMATSDGLGLESKRGDRLAWTNYREPTRPFGQSHGKPPPGSISNSSVNIVSASGTFITRWDLVGSRASPRCSCDVGVDTHVGQLHSHNSVSRVWGATWGRRPDSRATARQCHAIPTPAIISAPWPL
jgi:hypothetical protein